MDLLYHVEQIYSKFNEVESSKHTIKKYEDVLNKNRMEFDPVVFNSLRTLYGDVLKQFWERATIPLKSNRAIIFVERRCHPNLEFCLHNAVYYARGYSLHIFCSEANYDFIKTICGSQLQNIHIRKEFVGFGTPEEGKAEYNELLKKCEFWNKFEEEFVLTMETDSYLLRPIPKSIYKYDYVASKWSWSKTEPGGGGISHRKTAVMKQICNLEETRSIPMQDSFASTGITVLNGSSPTDTHYFTESIFSNNGVGTHQWWTFLHTKPLDIIRSCIEVYITLYIED